MSCQARPTHGAIVAAAERQRCGVPHCSPLARRCVRLLSTFGSCLLIAVQPLPTAGAAAEDAELRIVAFGDSTTVGYSAPESYPQKLARRLFEHGIAATVINSGVNGDTTAGAETDSNGMSSPILPTLSLSNLVSTIKRSACIKSPLK